MSKKANNDKDQLELPALEYFIPVVKFPQPDGSLLIKPGKPQVVEKEVTCAQFAKATGLSHKYVNQLCDEGQIQCRRKSPKAKSMYLIPRSEIDRYRNFQQ